MDYDLIVQDLGEMRRYHVLVHLCMWFYFFFAGTTTFVYSFTGNSEDDEKCECDIYVIYFKALSQTHSVAKLPNAMEEIHLLPMLPVEVSKFFHLTKTLTMKEIIANIILFK